MSLINTGILTIDSASVGPAVTGTKTVDPLILATGQDMGVHVLDAGLATGGGGGVLPHAMLHLDDVQTVNPEELGTLTALAMQSTSSSEQLHALSSCNALTAESPSTLTPSLSSSLTPSLSNLTSALPPALNSSLVPSFSTPLASSLSSSMALAGTQVPELLSLQTKTDLAGETAVGPLLNRVEVMAQSNGSKGMCQFVFPSHNGSYSGQKTTEMSSVTPCPVMVSFFYYNLSKVIKNSNLCLVFTNFMTCECVMNLSLLTSGIRRAVDQHARTTGPFSLPRGGNRKLQVLPHVHHRLAKER